ncbi:uncharacterized protein RCC_12344 [Ramularia collo-cygni]|uniref:DUF7730 domain-containing protein n=1 Tax=Ramularia collo-cygni TaxID=112498 RepID=A0A2D3V541_9PEZI|nr:uncharacterized protein RCC_12344 [Ramularia collo-cygni]CZT15383.1 uncharacterized protein RCC_12344 [Ramularia collo-cygni]
MATTQETMLSPREPGLEVNTKELHPQSESHLFRLPAELRQQIYEYVIGTGQVHIIMRSCTQSESPLFHHCTTIEGVVMHDYQKLTYSTCSHPTTFSTRYALSKMSSENIPVMYHNSRGHLPHLPALSTSDYIFPNWDMQHGKCYSDPQRDMLLQRYASTPCALHNQYVRHDTRNCTSCLEQQKILELEFGPPTAKQGLKKLHADSAVWVDGLLRSCGRIYDEARVLPFKLYSFDMGVGVDFKSAVETWLEPWQVAAIERLHVTCDIEGLGKIVDVVRSRMPGLKHLELDVVLDDVTDIVFERETGLDVDSIEVVVGFDWNCRFERQERRVLAEKLEQALKGHGSS